MNIIKSVVACVYLIMISMALSTDKGWRGIMPLHSTCEDVKRILGVSGCEIPTSTYDLENETVRVKFSKAEKPCQENGLHVSWNVPPGTVLDIIVILKKPLPLADFHVDNGKYEKVFSDFLNEVTYSNGEDGIHVKAINGEVREVIYTPGAKDSHLLCPNVHLPEQSNSSKEFPPSMFDSYGDLPFGEEKKRLDDFARALQAYAPDSKGYIVVYAGEHDQKGVARARAERAKAYIVKKYGIKESRVGTVDGGCLEEMSVELHIGPRDLPPPMTFPSVRK